MSGNFGLDRLVDWALDSLRELWPVTRIEEWEAGMLVRGGKIKCELAAGRMHLVWPFLDEVVSLPKTEVPLDLPTAKARTKDGIQVAVSANITYNLTDICLHYRTVYDGQRSMKLEAIALIASHVTTLESRQLFERRGVLERQLLRVLNETAHEWGMKVVRVHLTDCVVVSRVFFLYNDTTTAERENASPLMDE